VYGVSPGGNWEGHTILNRLASLALRSAEEEAVLADCRALLLQVRKHRVEPGFDDKVLVDWNGLTIAALAESALVFARSDWLDAASRAFRSILQNHWRDGTLYHSWRNGEVRHLATAEGYANLIGAGLALYAVSADEAFLGEAISLTDAAVADLWDAVGGGFYFASRHASDLLVRARFAHDDATPNANATMLANLSRLWLLTGEERYRELADATIRAFAAAVAGNPFAHASFLSAFDQYIDALQAVLVGDPASPEITTLRAAVLELPGPLPVLLYARSSAALKPGHPAHGKSAQGSAALYLCRGSRCALPVTRAGDARAAFASLG
ncbi:MAG: thioredoxin domain-containing protein, partial [Pseudomonadota bacterium]|nr:thioredoxin domain-containing protein [Pseudomonadota bacterium]